MNWSDVAETEKLSKAAFTEPRPLLDEIEIDLDTDIRSTEQTQIQRTCDAIIVCFYRKMLFL